MLDVDTHPEYCKALNEFVSAIALYSYNKKIKEFGVDVADDTSLSQAKAAALNLSNEMLKLPKAAQSEILLERAQQILKE